MELALADACGTGDGFSAVGALALLTAPLPLLSQAAVTRGCSEAIAGSGVAGSSDCITSVDAGLAGAGAAAAFGGASFEVRTCSRAVADVGAAEDAPRTRGVALAFVTAVAGAAMIGIGGN